MKTVGGRSVQSVPLFDWEAVPVLHGLTCRVSFVASLDVGGVARRVWFFVSFSPAIQRGQRRNARWCPRATETPDAESEANVKTRLVSCINSVFAWMQKRCKVENYRGGSTVTPGGTPFTKPTGFCYRGRLGNGAACWVGCFYGFNESDWKRRRRFILVSGKTGPVQHKRWFLKKDRNDSRMLVPVLQDHCRYFNFNTLFDDNLKCPFVCDLYYMIHLIL